MTNSLVEENVQIRTMRDERDRRLTKRQYVRYAFYRIDPVWRRLPLDEQVIIQEYHALS
jgi:hypothetical protein